MSIKKTLMSQGMKLMGDPRVMKLVQNEHFMQLMMGAMSVPGRVSTFAQEQTNRVAKVMDLATEQEVKDLRRTVRSLEEQLSEMKKQNEKSED